MGKVFDILRGELERLFSSTQIRDICNDYLEMDPDKLGIYSDAKPIFIKRLAEWCEKENATEALADVVSLLKRGMVDPRIKQAYRERYAEDLTQGTEISGYVIGEKLPDRRLGASYLCRHREDPTEYGDRYELMVVHHEYSLDRHAVKRFMVMMRSLGMLETQSVQMVESVGQLDDGRPYVVAQRLQGIPLKDLAPLPIFDALKIFEAVLNAVDLVHERGLIHADISADNIIVNKDETAEGESPKVTLIGFGVDKLFHRGGQGEGVDSRWFGTLAGVSPEQFRRSYSDPRSDIYALGTVIYELVTGCPPFSGISLADVASAHLGQTPPAIGSLVEWSVPPALESLVSRMMAKDPMQRPKSLDEIRPMIADAVRSAEQIAVLETQTGSIDDIKAAADALIGQPEDLELLAELKNEARYRNAWGAAVDVMEEAAMAASDSLTMRRLLLEAAEASTKYLKDIDRATQICANLLSREPGDEEVERVMFRALRAGGRYEELIGKLAEKASEAETNEGRAAFLVEIIATYMDDLKDFTKAFDYCLACVEQVGFAPKLISQLEVLTKRTERYEEFAAACGSAAQAAEGSGDAEAACVLYGKTGHYYLEKLDQPAYALTCFQKVLEHRPKDSGALLAISNMYRAAKQWDELAKSIIQLGEAENNPSARRDHMTEAAQIYHDKMSKTDDAIGLLKNVLDEDPTHMRAAELLIGIYESANNWEELAKLLANQLKTIQASKDQAGAQFRLGELYEDRLNDLKSAREHYEKALEMDESHIDSIKGLERIFARTGDTYALRGNLEKQLNLAVTQKQRLVLMERLAEICEEEFREMDKAIDYYRSILNVDGDNQSALVALTRLYNRTERWEDLSTILEQRAARSATDEDKKELLRERAEVLKNKIGDAKRAAEAFSKVASLGEDSALETLANTQEEAGNHFAAVETLRKVIGATTDAGTQKKNYLRIAGILFDKIKDPQEAISALRQARDIAPNDRDVLVEIRKVYISQGNYAAALESLEKELDIVEGKLARAETYAQMGFICKAHIGDIKRATEYFEQALELDKSNLLAGDNLSEIYRKENKWDKALTIYEIWADSAKSFSVEKQAELYKYLGEAYARLGRQEEALKILSKATELAGDEANLVRLFGEVALNLEQYELAKEQLRKYFSMAGDNLRGSDKVEMLIKLGKAYLGVGDVSEAAKMARQATVMAPDAKDAHILLADISDQKGDYRGMVESYNRALSGMEPGNAGRVDVLKRIANVLFEKLKDADGAISSLHNALESNPNDRILLGELLKIYTAIKRFDDVIAVVLRIAGQIDDPQQLARYYLTVAKIYRRELQKPVDAIKYYEMAVDKTPSLIDAQTAIVEILNEQKDWKRLEQHYKKRIAALPQDSTAKDKLDLFVPLCDLLLKQPERQNDGILLLEAISKLDPGNLAWQEKLSEMYGWKREHAEKSLGVHRRLLAANAARVDSFRMLYHIYSAIEEPDRAWCSAAVLSMIEQATPEEETYYREYLPNDIPDFEQRLREEHWQKLLSHRDMNQTISSIFSVIRGAVFKFKGADHSSFGLNRASAIDPTKDNSVFSGFVNFASAAIGLPAPNFYVHDGNTTDIQVVETNPPALIIGGSDLSLTDRKALIFKLGQQLTLLRPGFIIRKLVTSGTEMSAWLLASLKSFVPALSVPGDLAGPISERLAPLRDALDATDWEKLQGHVHSFVSQAEDVNLKRWIKAVDYTMDRVGLLLCGDMSVAIRIMKEQIDDKTDRADRIRALTLFMISDEHFKLREYLGTALQKG